MYICTNRHGICNGCPMKRAIPPEGPFVGEGLITHIMPLHVVQAQVLGLVLWRPIFA